MITAVTLLVLRCAHLAASKAFYEALGLTFRLEDRGHEQMYWASPDGV
jgi:hypothetical protein